jgi:hypothetical protein
VVSRKEEIGLFLRENVGRKPKTFTARRRPTRRVLSKLKKLLVIYLTAFKQIRDFVTESSSQTEKKSRPTTPPHSAQMNKRSKVEWWKNSRHLYVSSAFAKVLNPYLNR